MWSSRIHIADSTTRWGSGLRWQIWGSAVSTALPVVSSPHLNTGIRAEHSCNEALAQELLILYPVYSEVIGSFQYCVCKAMRSTHSVAVCHNYTKRRYTAAIWVGKLLTSQETDWSHWIFISPFPPWLLSVATLEAFSECIYKPWISFKVQTFLYCLLQSFRIVGFLSSASSSELHSLPKVSQSVSLPSLSFVQKLFSATVSGWWKEPTWGVCV